MLKAIEINDTRAAREFLSRNFGKLTGLAPTCVQRLVTVDKIVAVGDAKLLERETLDFNSGVSSEIKLVEKWLWNRIKLIASKQRVCFFAQDIWMKKADYEVAATNKPNYFIHDQSPYILLRDVADEILFFQSLRWPTSHVTPYAISTYIPRYTNARELADDEFNKLLENIAEFYVTAFDQEGLLVVT